MLNFIIDAIVAVCAVMLVCYMVRAYLRATQKNSQTESNAIDDYLQKMTHATGISVYDTFCISAKEWRVSADRIDQDFKGNSLTDKRLWLFYSALIVFFWGGAFILCLYVFPVIWPEELRASIHLGPP